MTTKCPKQNVSVLIDLGATTHNNHWSGARTPLPRNEQFHPDKRSRSTKALKTVYRRVCAKLLFSPKIQNLIADVNIRTEGSF